MPIKPEPYKLKCHFCGWSKRVFPQSDALLPDEWVDTCPKCGCREGISKEPLVGAGVFAFVERWFS